MMPNDKYFTKSDYMRERLKKDKILPTTPLKNKKNEYIHRKVVGSLKNYLVAYNRKDNKKADSVVK